MTCKDCIHYDICYVIYAAGKFQSGAELCKNFKNKAEYVEVKHGEWKASVMSTGAPHCSLCNGVAPSRYTYCPHCGAKMDRRSDTE